MSLLRWHGKAVLARIRGASRQGLEAAAVVVEREAKGNIRAKDIIDTGNLLGSVSHELLDDRARVGTNVEYGIYHEYGTYKMAARPWLRPAVDENQGAIRKAFAEQVRRVLG